LKIVLDTNVLIAAFISPSGRSYELLERCATLHSIICSEFILEELREKLVNKFKRETRDVDSVIDLLRTRIQLVVPVMFEEPIGRDLEDEPILGTAVAGEAERIITGDKDLLSLESYRGIKIVKPSEFLTEDEAEK
jgi:uncharacterized protein